MLSTTIRFDNIQVGLKSRRYRDLHVLSIQVTFPSPWSSEEWHRVLMVGIRLTCYARLSPAWISQSWISPGVDLSQSFAVS